MRRASRSSITRKISADTGPNSSGFQNRARAWAVIWARVSGGNCASGSHAWACSSLASIAISVTPHAWRMLIWRSLNTQPTGASNIPSMFFTSRAVTMPGCNSSALMRIIFGCYRHKPELLEA